MMAQRIAGAVKTINFIRSRQSRLPADIRQTRAGGGEPEGSMKP